MPTYDYVCDACDHQFELFQSIKDEPKRKCPEVRPAETPPADRPRRGHRLQGSGFYKTDYRSESYKKAAAAEKSNGSRRRQPAKSETKSETKSDAKGKEKKRRVVDSG